MNNAVTNDNSVSSATAANGTLVRRPDGQNAAAGAQQGLISFAGVPRSLAKGAVDAQGDVRAATSQASASNPFQISTNGNGIPVRQNAFSYTPKAAVKTGTDAARQLLSSINKPTDHVGNAAETTHSGPAKK